MSEDVQARLDALRLVREWSSGITVIQSAALAVVANSISWQPSPLELWLLVPLCLCLIGSIVVGAGAVAGTIPYIAQNLPGDPKCDIYTKKGGLGGLSLGAQCMLQMWLFTFALLLFVAFFAARAYEIPARM